MLSRAGHLQTMWRTRRSGVGAVIGDEAITVTAIRRGELVWTQIVKRDAEQPLAAALAAALSGLPKPFRSRRTRFVVALSRRDAYVKCICGVPVTSKMSTRKLVAATPARFFPVEQAVVLTGGIRRSPLGIWAAAYNGDVVQAIRDLCTTVGFSRVWVVPLAATLGVPRASSSVVVHDSGVMLYVAYDERGWLKTLEPGRHVPSVNSDSGIDESSESSRQAIRACRGALLHAAGDPIGLKLMASRSSLSSATRLALAACACATSLGLALTLPTALQVHRSGALAREIRASTQDYIRAARAAAELRQASRGVRELSSFDHHLPVSELLARMARALPNGGAVVMLQVDTSAGSVVIVAPRASEVIQAFEHIPGISAPTIVGPIAPEQTPVSGVPATTSAAGFERVTIQFQRTESP